MEKKSKAAATKVKCLSFATIFTPPNNHRPARLVAISVQEIS